VALAADETVAAVELWAVGVGWEDIHRIAGAEEFDAGWLALAIDTGFALAAVRRVWGVLVAALEPVETPTITAETVVSAVAVFGALAARPVDAAAVLAVIVAAAFGAGATLGLFVVAAKESAAAVPAQVVRR